MLGLVRNTKVGESVIFILFIYLFWITSQKGIEIIRRFEIMVLN